MAYTLGSPADEEAPAKKSEGPMDVDAVKTQLGLVLQDCITYIDGELSEERAEATAFYNGEPFGNEEDGRSKVVITEVRDVVRGVVPSLLRVIFGPERVVEFIPKRADAADAAEQATDYIQHCFVEENSGFLKTHAVLKDGLVRKLGVLKYWWEADPPKTYELEHVTQTQLEQLVASGEVEITSAKLTKQGQPAPVSDDPSQPQEPPIEAEYTVNCVYTPKDGHVCVEALPGEEFLFDRNARDRDNCIVMAHRCYKTKGELLEMGVDEELIDEWGHYDASLEGNQERIERNQSVGNIGSEQNNAGEANEKILYVEAYINMDVDGDDIAELRRICAIGPTFHPVNGEGGEPCDERPFAFFCPDPEPHTLLGLSFADLVKDIQLVQSSLVRGMLDSLSASLFPRIGYVEGAANVVDIMNNTIGAPIRLKNPNAIVPIETPFTGDKVLPVIEMFNDVSERRTGRDKGAIGLDADSLQSSTKEAVGAAVQASQESTELLARIFCEMTLKPLFMGMYRLFVKYQPKARTVRLRGKWVDVDPAAWDADMDMTVNVALGSSAVADKIETLTGIKETMEGIFQTVGYQNPICTVAQYRNVLAKLVELRGYKDTTQFFNIVPPDWQPPQPAAPPPSPEQVIAQAQLEIERMRTQKELEIKQAELQLKQQQFAADSALKLHNAETDRAVQLRKIAVDAEIRKYQIDAQFHGTLTQAEMEQESAAMETFLEHGRIVQEQSHNAAVDGAQHALDVQSQQHDQQLQEDQQAHEQSMREREVAAQEQAASQAASDSSE